MKTFGWTIASLRSIFKTPLQGGRVWACDSSAVYDYLNMKIRLFYNRIRAPDESTGRWIQIKTHIFDCVSQSINPIFLPPYRYFKEKSIFVTNLIASSCIMCAYVAGINYGADFYQCLFVTPSLPPWLCGLYMWWWKLPSNLIFLRQHHY